MGAGTFCRKSQSREATGKGKGRGVHWAKSYKAGEPKQEESFSEMPAQPPSSRIPETEKRVLV